MGGKGWWQGGKGWALGAEPHSSSPTGLHANSSSTPATEAGHGTRKPLHTAQSYELSPHIGRPRSSQAMRSGRGSTCSWRTHMQAPLPIIINSSSSLTSRAQTWNGCSRCTTRIHPQKTRRAAAAAAGAQVRAAARAAPAPDQAPQCGGAPVHHSLRAQPRRLGAWAAAAAAP